MSDKEHELSIAERVKQVNLARKNKTTEVVEITPESLPEYAFGTTYLDKKWYTVELKFDPVTKQSMVVRLIEADGQTGACETLKIQVGNWCTSFQEFNG